MMSIVGAIIAVIVSVIGLIVQIVAVGIYIGKLEGFKVLVDFRFQTLEKKQDKHNSLIERTYQLEKVAEVHDEQIKVANHRIEDLEKED